MFFCHLIGCRYLSLKSFFNVWLLKNYNLTYSCKTSWNISNSLLLWLIFHAWILFKTQNLDYGLFIVWLTEFYTNPKQVRYGHIQLSCIISYRSNINITIFISLSRQLRETFDWIFSESMLIYYIRSFQESMWPDGHLAESLPARSETDKMKTRIEAKEKFLQSLPGRIIHRWTVHQNLLDFIFLLKALGLDW